MITIERVRLDFQAGNEEFPRELYGKWDEFCRVAVEEVISDTLARYDNPDEMIRIGELMLELGTLPEEEFYDHFPRLLAGKLDETFSDYLRNREKYPIEVIPIHRNQMEILLAFLFYGMMPSAATEEGRDLSRLLQAVIGSAGKEFIFHLRKMGNQRMRTRLVMQFTDADLEAVAGAAEPSEAPFITEYVRYLLASHRRLKRPEITAGDYRGAVWQVILGYLLHDGLGFFSRKQMVRQTIRELAAHFNLDFLYLLQLLTSGLEKFSGEWILVPELLVILSEIRTEVFREQPESAAVLAVMDALLSGSPADGDSLRRLLSREDTCHRLLLPLKEEEIIRLVEQVIPAEREFIVSYAANLDRGKERGMLEGKAGNEFRVLKWEFLFVVLLSSPVASFERRRFVWAVIRKIASRYNLDPFSLLAFLCADQENMPVRLRETLRELYRLEMERVGQTFAEGKDLEKYGTEERKRLIYVLSHPSTARRFLAAMPEGLICRLVEIVIPAESRFIISYARNLDREKDRGVFEGRAGSEFRTLKWEFIFLVALSIPASAFSRKYFVRTVLAQMASHYNIGILELLGYFDRACKSADSGLPEELRQVFAGLWEEELLTVAGKAAAESGRKFDGLFRMLADRREIARQEWDTVGCPFAVEVIARFQKKEVADFVRVHREELRRLLFCSAENLRLVYEKMCRTPGMLKFLFSEYGEKEVLALFAQAGIDLGTLAGCTLVAWQHLAERRDSGAMIWWLENSPQAVIRLWQDYPEKEALALLLRMGEDVTWGKTWLRRMGSAGLRLAADRVRELAQSWLSFPGEQVWLSWLLPCTMGRCADLSTEEILALFWKKLSDWLPENYRKELNYHINKNHRQFSDFQRIMMKTDETHPQSSGMDADSKPIVPPEEVPARIYIENAGLILLTPYFPRLFSLLGLTDGGKFTGQEQQIKAIFLMQEILGDTKKWQEPDLFLNKLLAGIDPGEPIPVSVEITDQEREMILSMTKGAMANWDKMKNTSLEGFRHSFLIRNGVLERVGDHWQMVVEERGYDILLGSLPWGFSPVRFPWMPEPIYTRWR